MLRTLAVPLLILLIVAVALPGCRLKPRAAMPPLPPEDEIPVEATGLRSVFVSLHMGDTAKPSAEPVTVRLRWNEQPIATETIGRGHRWDPYTSRALELPLPRPLRMDAEGSLLLEIVKPEVVPGRPSWTVEVEALGRLTDGTVLLLLDRTEPVHLGGGEPTEAAWLLRAR